MEFSFAKPWTSCLLCPPFSLTQGPGEHCCAQTQTDNRVLAEAEFSKHWILAHCLRKKKKKEFRYTEEDWKKSSPLPTSCLPQSDTAQCAEWDLLGPWFLPQGKLRVCRWVSSFPSYMWCCHKSLFFSHSTLNKVMSCMTKGEKKLRELQIKRSEGIKWIYTYPTTSQTISGSLPMKHWRCLIYKNPQLSHGYPWCPGCLTNTYPHPEADSLWILRWWQQIWKMVSEHTEKTDLDQWARERP